MEVKCTGTHSRQSLGERRRWTLLSELELLSELDILCRANFFFFPLILRSERVLKMTTSFCAAQIGSAPAVACHPSKLLLADAAGKVFHDALQLAQGLGLLTDNLLSS